MTIRTAAAIYQASLVLPTSRGHGRRGEEGDWSEFEMLVPVLWDMIAADRFGQVA